VSVYWEKKTKYNICCDNMHWATWSKVCVLGHKRQAIGNQME